jgi:hypothetical protein
MKRIMLLVLYKFDAIKINKETKKTKNKNMLFENILYDR